MEIKHWQAKTIAKFLLAAAGSKAVAINVRTESEAIVFEAVTMDGKVATFRVFGDKRHLVMCIDEWGLMAELE